MSTGTEETPPQTDEEVLIQLKRQRDILVQQLAYPEEYWIRNRRVRRPTPQKLRELEDLINRYERKAARARGEISRNYARINRHVRGDVRS